MVFGVTDIQKCKQIMSKFYFIYLFIYFWGVRAAIIYLLSALKY